MLGNKFEFANCLINTFSKKVYNWYELRYLVCNDNIVKPLVFNKEIDRLYRIMYEVQFVSEENKRFLEEIVDEIVTNDKCIIENNPVKIEIILRLIDLVDAYGKNREKYLRKIKDSANLSKILKDQTKANSCKQ